MNWSIESTTHSSIWSNLSVAHLLLVPTELQDWRRNLVRVVVCWSSDFWGSWEQLWLITQMTLEEIWRAVWGSTTTHKHTLFSPPDAGGGDPVWHWTKVGDGEKRGMRGERRRGGETWEDVGRGIKLIIMRRHLPPYLRLSLSLSLSLSLQSKRWQ